MQAIIKLPLEGPLELGMVEVTRVHLEVIGVHRNGRVLEIDDDLDAVMLFARTELKKRVFVETELSQHAFESGHETIVI